MYFEMYALLLAITAASSQKADDLDCWIDSEPCEVDAMFITNLTRYNVTINCSEGYPIDSTDARFAKVRSVHLNGCYSHINTDPMTIVPNAVIDNLTVTQFNLSVWRATSRIRLGALKVLRLQDNILNEISKEVWDRMPQLEELWIAGVPTQMPDSRALGKLVHLKTLLIENQTWNIDADLPHLENLTLTDSEISFACESHHKNRSHLASLQHLTVNNSTINCAREFNETVPYSCEAHHFPRIHSIAISNVDIRAFNLNQFLSVFPKIRSLAVTSCGLTYLTIDMLDLHQYQLDHLDITNNRLEEIRLEHEDLPYNGTLKIAINRSFWSFDFILSHPNLSHLFYYKDDSRDMNFVVPKSDLEAVKNEEIVLVMAEPKSYKNIIFYALIIPLLLVLSVAVYCLLMPPKREPFYRSILRWEKKGIADTNVRHQNRPLPSVNYESPIRHETKAEYEDYSNDHDRNIYEEIKEKVQCVENNLFLSETAVNVPA